jgi:hypothetical protein
MLNPASATTKPRGLRLPRMAEITNRRQGEFVRKVFEILWDHPDGVPAREVLSRIERETELSPFELSTYPKQPNIQRFTKVVRFATIGPVKARWMEKEKGRWTLTEEGRAAYREFEDPEALFRRATELSAARSAWTSAMSKSSLTPASDWRGSRRGRQCAGARRGRADTSPQVADGLEGAPTTARLRPVRVPLTGRRRGVGSPQESFPL